MINKYQQGGAAQGSILQEIAKLPQDKQKQIMAAFGKWAQSKGINIQQLQGNEQALEQAMGQFLQEMQGAQKARLGAKLNYIRELKGNAPEGMIVEYYKCGGQVKKKFVKAAGGDKVKDGKKVIADFKKKKACGGSKMKFELGGKNLNKKPLKTTQPVHPNDTVHIQNPKTKKMEVRDVTNDHRHKQYKPLTKEEYQRQSNSKKNDIDLKGYCKGGKAKK